MLSPPRNCLVVLGPTASGKTTLAVRLAHEFGGEIISADSRQVYRGLNIGSGKDLQEYGSGNEAVPYHLIDVADIHDEFSLFDYQQRCYQTVETLHHLGVLPVITGGTGLYLEAVLKGYRLVEVPENADLRRELAALSMSDLQARLRSTQANLHNTTDLVERDRVIRAIEIAEHRPDQPPPAPPEICPYILGIKWNRRDLHQRIEARLRARLDEGMVEEVSGLLDRGISPDRLHGLGLEYRFVTEFLEGAIKNRNDLFQKLSAAIKNFAKRQESWFRRMERRGTKINWVDGADWTTARAAVLEAFPKTPGSEQ